MSTRARVARLQRPTGIVLAGVWFIALAIRLLYIWQISYAPFFDLRLGDAESYHLWARRIAHGDWLGQGVFYQAPLYPYFLAIVYRLFGDHVTTVRLVHAVIGSASCALVARAGMTLFGCRGAIAGLLIAIYPTALFLDSLLEKSVLVTLLTAALVAVIAGARDRITAVRHLWIGIILGLLALTRENALLLIVPVAWWVRSVSTWRMVRLMVLGVAIVLLPVALRNLAIGGEFQLTTSQLGPNFYIGNHIGATGTYEALVEAHGSAADEREDATRLAEQASGRRLTAGEVSRYWLRRSLDDIRSQPLDWLALVSRKFALALNALETADTESQDVYAEWSWLLRVLSPFNFGVLLGVAAFGIALTANAWRRIWFLHAIAVTYTLSVAAFYVFARYRFPIAVMLTIFAAGGLAVAFDVFVRSGPRSAPRASTLRIALIAAAASIGFAYLPVADERAARAVHYFDIGATLARNGAGEGEAMRFYERALAEVPGMPAAESGLGTLLVETGRPAEAIPHFRTALAAWPDHFEARYNLGLALARTGAAEEAAGELTLALGARPDDVDMLAALAKVQLTLDQPEAALQHYQQAIALRPDHVAAIVGSGVALATMGRADEALARFRRALDLDPANADAHNNLGGALANAGRVAEAVPHFERAVELAPRDENARRNLERARRVLANGK